MTTIPVKSRNVYSYCVFYPRTAEWYSPGGDWYKISHWLQDVQKCNWDYVDNHFVFAEESDKVMFLLRWT